MTPTTILIRAQVVTKNEKTFTVILENGFGRPEVIVHQDHALTDTTPIAVV